MKTLSFIAAVSAIALIITSCGVFGKSTASSTTSALSTAVSTTGSTNGQAAGAALKSLYAQYKADGKMDMTNFNNIINLATLANNVKGLKGQSNKSSFYKDFAAGLILGSGNLVSQTNSANVMSGLTGLVNNVDLSGLQNVASKFSGATANTAAKAQTAVGNASSIATSVSNILNLFKK